MTTYDETITRIICPCHLYATKRLYRVFQKNFPRVKKLIVFLCNSYKMLCSCKIYCLAIKPIAFYVKMCYYIHVGWHTHYRLE